MNTEPLKKVLGGPTGHFPVEAEIVGYLANSWSVPTLLGLFAAGWAVILGVTNLLVKRHNPTLGSSDKAAILWFVLSRSKDSLPLLCMTLLTETLCSWEYTSFFRGCARGLPLTKRGGVS